MQVAIQPYFCPLIIAQQSLFVFSPHHPFYKFQIDMASIKFCQTSNPPACEGISLLLRMIYMMVARQFAEVRQLIQVTKNAFTKIVK